MNEIAEEDKQNELVEVLEFEVEEDLQVEEIGHYWANIKRVGNLDLPRKNLDRVR